MRDFRPFTIATIVEGHGEEQSVPLLIRRVLDPQSFRSARPIRVSAKRFLNDDNEFERYLKFARRDTDGYGGILILLDLDDGCAASEGPALRERAEKIVHDCPVRFVFAVREFETWFLHSIASLSGKRNLKADLVSPEQPEQFRGAKEWLTSNMVDPRRQSYSSLMDQPAFAQLMDLDLARNSRSFRKLENDLRSFEDSIR
jgi:hypothetical protein